MSSDNPFIIINFYYHLVINLLFVCCILVAKCPALIVGHLVRTLPNDCVTSQTKINTNCTFSCPRGYKLQGPSYKQCESRGQWTNSAKTVSCAGKWTRLWSQADVSLLVSNIVLLLFKRENRLTPGKTEAHKMVARFFKPIELNWL